MTDDLLEMSVEYACRKLTIAYARLIDLYDVDGLAALWTEDARWDRPGNPTLVGREAIRGFLASRPPSVLTRHMATNFLLESFTADTAVATSYYTGYNADGFGGPGGAGQASTRMPFSIGEYRDEFRRTPEGWRFSHRITWHVFHTFGH